MGKLLNVCVTRRVFSASTVKVVELHEKKSRVCDVKKKKEFNALCNGHGNISDRYSICFSNEMRVTIVLYRLASDTYVNFFPLVDVADETRQSEEPDEGQQFGQAKDPQRSAGLQDLKAFAKVLHP